MSEIGSGSGSSYPGSLDTNNTIEVNSPNVGKTKARAEVVNDLAASIIAIQTELGIDPAGTLADVKTFLRTEHSADGTHSELTVDSLTMQSGQIQMSKGADVASANALPVLTDGNFFDVTGTTTITSINSLGVGTGIWLHFDGILTLTHHATDLVLPGGDNITTAAGDIIGFYEYAAGDWRLMASSNPAFTHTHTPDAGSVVQMVNTQDGAVATGTTTIPIDDTIPQNTEGDEVMTLAITPTSATNKLKIEVEVLVSKVGGIQVSTALFQDTTANALAAVSDDNGSTNRAFTSTITHWMTSGTTSATTFKVRIGGTAGTATFNGENGARIFGGVIPSSITITEIQV